MSDCVCVCVRCCQVRVVLLLPGKTRSNFKKTHYDTCCIENSNLILIILLGGERGRGNGVGGSQRVTNELNKMYSKKTIKKSLFEEYNVKFWRCNKQCQWKTDTKNFIIIYFIFLLLPANAKPALLLLQKQNAITNVAQVKLHLWMKMQATNANKNNNKRQKKQTNTHARRQRKCKCKLQIPIGTRARSLSHKNSNLSSTFPSLCAHVCSHLLRCCCCLSERAQCALCALCLCILCCNCVSRYKFQWAATTHCVASFLGRESGAGGQYTRRRRRCARVFCVLRVFIIFLVCYLPILFNLLTHKNSHYILL